MRIARLCLVLLLLLIPLLGGQPGVIPLAVFGVLTAFGWLGWASEREAALPKGFLVLCVAQHNTRYVS